MRKLLPIFSRSLTLLFSMLTCSLAFSQSDANYCPSKSAAPWELWVTNVELNTIYNPSDKFKDYATLGYSDFTNLSTTMTKGQSYALTVGPGASWAGILSDAYCRVWIDFNQNGIFEDSEKVLEAARLSPYTASVTIPPGASTGATRMRVAVKSGAYPGACETFDKGEVEDYTVKIMDAAALPDLTLANLNLSYASIAAGQVINYTFDIKNIGLGAAPGNFKVRAYISKDTILSADDAQDGTIPTGGFPAGFIAAKVSGATRIPANFSPGRYFLILKVDADSEVAESNENNNLLVSALAFPVVGVGGCDNLTDGGDISGDESFCQAVSCSSKSCGPGFSGQPVHNLALPSGGSGAIEYVWVKNYAHIPASVRDGVVISSGTKDSLDNFEGDFNCYGPHPNFVYNALYFRRFARRAGCADYVASAHGASKENHLEALPTPRTPADTTVFIPAGQNCYTGLTNIKHLETYVPPCHADYYKTNEYYIDSLTGASVNPACVKPGVYYYIYRLYISYYYCTYNTTSVEARTKITVLGGAPDPGCRSHDSLQLVALYNTAGGAQWTNPWNLSKPMNTWYGVTLSQGSGCVVGLRLGYNHLIGTLPNLNLPSLEILNLSENQLSGPLPNFNLPNLSVLYLSNNQFSGAIPSFTLPNLGFFDLSSNQLSGCVPPVFKTFCGKLPYNVYGEEDFYVPSTFADNPDLAFQSFADFCATDINVCGLGDADCRRQDSLQLVKLYNATNGARWLATWDLTKPINTWAGVTTLGARGCVLRIQLAWNQMGGSLPSLSFSNLIALDLHQNGFTGPLPDFYFPNIQTLDLSGNNFSGCIPASFKAFCGKKVDIGNNLSVSLPYEAFCANNTGSCAPDQSASCRLQDSLQLVALYNATNGANWINRWDLTKPINTWYGISLNLTGCVESVILDHNNLQGAIPNIALPNLKTLNLTANYLNGAIPNFNLPTLETLNLSSNDLSGAIPNFNLPNLKSLDVSSTSVSGTVPNFNLPNLVKLSIQADYNLSGVIPNFNLPKLTALDLARNNLTGTIPNFNLPALQQLNLSNNSLAGAMPNFNLPNIISIDLSDNQLSGCIPNSYKTFCGKSVVLNGNPNLATQDFAAFCSAGAGACSPMVNYGLSLSAPDFYRPFQTLSFRVGFQNAGSTVLNNIVINFPFPDKTANGGTTTASVGQWQEYCPGGVRCYQWTIPTLALGQGATLDVPVYVQDATGPLFGTAQLSSVSPLTPVASVTFTVRPAAGAGTANLTSRQPILDFEARADLDKARLMWISNAANIDYFEIRKLDDRGAWQTVGTQKARGDNRNAAYTLTDPALAEGSHFYQVKAVGLDGSAQTSAIKEVKTSDWSEALVFPNPATDEITVALKNYAGKDVRLTLYNSFGTLVKTLQINAADDHLTTLNVSDLQQGGYYIRISAAGKRDAARRLVILQRL